MVKIVEVGQFSGPPGPPGTAGVGVPTGGTTGQVLAKTSSADYATSWQTGSGGGGGVIPYTFVPTKTANYNANANEYIPVDATSGAITIFLPTAPANGSRVAVDIIVNPTGNNVTISRGGTDTLGSPGGGQFRIMPVVAQKWRATYNSGCWFEDVRNGFSTANAIPVTPTATLISTNIQAALQELDGDVQGLSANGSVTNLKLATGANNTVKGTLSGAISDITSAQLATLLGTGSGGGTTNFLRADGTWAAPPSGGSGTPSGPAGGSLAGTYPDPTIKANIITGTELAPLSVTTGHIVTDAVTNVSLANMVQATFKGRLAGGGTGDPQDMNSGQATAILDTFTNTLKGLAPSSGGGTTNFLRADGTWAAPPGGGGGSVSADTIWDAKGDLAVGTGADTALKLSVGTDGQALLVDSSQSSGLRWGTGGGGVLPYTFVATKTANYTANANDYVPVDATSGALTITLPTAPASGTRIAVDIIANPSAFNVTVSPGGSDKIGTPTGVAFRIMTSNAHKWRATYNGGCWYEDVRNGFVSAGNTPVTTTATLTSTNVQTALQELDGDIQAMFTTSVTVKNGIAAGGGAAMLAPTAGYGLECRSGGIGYGVGTGTSVNQATNQTTPVTANFLCGKINMMSAAGSTAWSLFIVNNSLVAATDMVVVTIYGAVQNYHAIVNKVEAGKFQVSFQSLGGTASDAPVVTFMVLKGVIS